ncbi:SAM hydrolase/SAM-dependent halogenase family protein [Leptothoe sp. PORK10 BA2]|uniref:SAM hydrolase/SAM-dependent halogenase family protein n=1 Tax=Leptothoe sp. PORK10 BA2 TaxID=3110254 RepID=UPI002B1FDE14|nr:SAM-dependent chlorinase/fluorinase [Leptothoe sp. PORK10 BA2]MEA5462373.1 SAM-dependent chlorinase/fluorinase [Leptothoe sp. PORK10 BA2]
MGVITLLTDFGHTDSYVGVMKGVIAGISPHSQVVDLTHGILPQDILAARFNLLTSYGYFPGGTVHGVVVDPGVGTQRAAIAVQVATENGGQMVVAPDNGILTGFPITAAVALVNADYWLTPQPSHTFHGRDIFASVAAHLANGVPMEQLGTPLAVSSLVRLSLGNAVATGHGYLGSIQYIDHFGNLVTTILGHKLTGQSWQVCMGGRMVRYSTTYGHGEPGEALALIGSHGYVEIAVNGGSAAQVWGAKVGDDVELVTLPRG